MDREEACQVLGLSVGADDIAIRAAHRRRIRETHPDAGGSVRDAARVNEALHTLRETMREAPASTARGPSRVTAPAWPPDVDQFFLVDERPRDLLTRLAEAGHAVGEVVFVDVHEGLLEIVVGAAPAVGQLAVMVGDARPEGTPVSFTLEPLGVTPAPPINDVVGALMAELRR